MRLSLTMIVTAIGSLLFGLAYLLFPEGSCQYIVLFLNHLINGSPAILVRIY